MIIPDQHIILYDGLCRLCHAVVRYFGHRNRKNLFRFVAVQSAEGQHLVREFSLTKVVSSGVVLIDGKTILTGFDAALLMFDKLGGIYKLACLLKLIPARWRNAVYRFIAARRYRLFGRCETCVTEITR